MWKLVVFLLLTNGQEAAVDTRIHFPSEKACIKHATLAVQKIDLPDYDLAKPRCVKEWVDPEAKPT